MRALFVAAALGTCALTSPSLAQTIDPLARAGGGSIECVDANPAARTCRAMSTYRVLDDGRIVNDAIVHIRNEPHVILYGSSASFMRDGMLCSVPNAEEFYASRLTVDGAPVPPDAARQAQEAMFAAVSEFREMCSRYVADGDGAAVAVIIDGVERPDLAMRVIWVRPEDGYTIGAADASPT